MTEVKQSILMLSSWYPSRENKTEGCFVHEQVRMFQKRGHTVIVLKPNLNGSVKDTFKGKVLNSRNYVFEGVVVHEVNVNVYLPRLKLYYYKTLQKKAIQIIQKQQLKFDIIHSHALLTAGIIAPQLSLKFKKPLFHTEHTSGLIFAPEQFDELDKRNIQNLINSATNILFVSEYAKKKSLTYKDNSTKKITVLPNIVADIFFETPFSIKKNNILVIGDFIERKNHAFLLKVWGEFQKCAEGINKETILIFAGNGFESKSFKKLAHGISNIETRSRLHREEVLELISESKLVLSASKLETFGLTIAETLALGTPVVVTDSGGPRDIVENGDGFIITPGDVNLFAQKMIDVLDGKHDEQNVIRQRCQQKFSEDIIYSKLTSIYES